MDGEDMIPDFIQLLSQVPCLISWQDLKCNLLGCNQFFADFYGVKCSKDVVGICAQKMYLDANEDSIKLLMGQVVREKKVVPCLERLSSISGHVIYIQSYKVPLINGDGIVIGVISVSFDITHNINKINFLQKIINKLPGHIWWTDNKSRVLGCNQKMATALGYDSVDAILGASNYDLLDGSSDEDEREISARIVDSTDASVIKNGLPFRGEEVVVIQGKHKVFLSEKLPLKNDHGAITGLLGVAQDITDYKNRYETTLYILSLLPGHIWWTDIEGTVLGSNDLMAKSFGYQKSNDLIGKKAIELMPENATADQKRDFVESMNRIDKQVMESGNPFRGEETLEINDEVKVFYSEKMPLKDIDGKVTGTIGIAQDITELKKTQIQLKKANEVKSEFIANMSHDLRTPITGMLGESAFIEENSDNKEVQESARFLKEATQQLLRLSNDILEYVTLESEHFDEPISVFNPIEVVEQVVTLMRVSTRHKSLGFQVKIDPQVPVAVKGYGQYFERIVSNLVANAIKFTEHGFIHVYLNVALQESDQITLDLIVEDTGVGIPADKYEEIFDQFYKLSSSYQGIYKGSGLGLYSVKQYVGQMQGNIKVDSVVGKGTKFIVTLPFMKAVAAETVKIDFSRSAPRAPIEPQDSAEITMLNTSVNKAYKVLVVEDSPLPARAVMRLLNDQNCETKLVNTGEEAVKEALRRRYDLILMDIGLPGIDGIEATRQIRVLPENNDVPIVALTGHARGLQKDACLNAGMQEVYAKPLSKHQLKSMLHDYVEQSESMDMPSLQGTIDKSQLDVQATLQKYETSDPKQLLEMFEATMQFIPDELAQLTKAVQQDDMVRVQLVMQDIKGGLSYIVAPTANDLTITWDVILHQEEVTKQSLDIMLKQMGATLNGLLDAIEQVVAAIKAS